MSLLQVASDKRGKAEQLAAKIKFKNQVQQTSNSAYSSVMQAINTSLPPTPASLVRAELEACLQGEIMLIDNNLALKEKEVSSLTKMNVGAAHGKNTREIVDTG